MDALDLLALLAAIAVRALLCLITCQSFQILSSWATSSVEEVASTGQLLVLRRLLQLDLESAFSSSM